MWTDEEEWSSVPKCNELRSRLDSNECDSRYPRFLPYKNTAIKLPSCGTFINASKINQTNMIVGELPQSNTRSKFWEMILLNDEYEY